MAEVHDACLCLDNVDHPALLRVSDHVRAAFQFLETVEQALAERRALFQDRAGTVAEVNQQQSAEILALDVGGTRFHASAATLAHDADGMLAMLCSGAFARGADADDVIFLDRDPTHFSHVLHYLRGGPMMTYGLDVRREFAFFNLPWRPEWDAWHQHPDHVLFDRHPPAVRFPGNIYRNSTRHAAGQSSHGWGGGCCTLGVRLLTPCLALWIGFCTDLQATATWQAARIAMLGLREGRVASAQGNLWSHPEGLSHEGTTVWLQLDLAASVLRLKVNDFGPEATIPVPLGRGTVAHPTFWDLGEGEAFEVLQRD